MEFWVVVYFAYGHVQEMNRGFDKIGIVHTAVFTTYMFYYDTDVFYLCDVYFPCYDFLIKLNIIVHRRSNSDTTDAEVDPFKFRNICAKKLLRGSRG